MMETPLTTTIHAIVCQVCSCSLLVCDQSTNQKVLVHTEDACCFCAGEHVCIHFDGAMTNSLPPQINATSIERLCC